MRGILRMLGLVAFALALGSGVGWPARTVAATAAAPVPAQVPGIGIAAHRPVFGGACKTCPWGVVADVVKAAMKPYGYDVQVCYHCFMADAPRGSDAAQTRSTRGPPSGGMKRSRRAMRLCSCASLNGLAR